ncbi:disease resistance protein RPS2-like [Zingiber officinale]|nr:disease resistance protein RPS2-like [Zingiber officinale]XP_042421685.1 disease resistance protein RPS2-like [Zingiber officinale]
MADIISGISSIFTCLKGCCFQSCNYIVSFEGAISSLIAELDQLKSKSMDIKRQVEAAQRDELNVKQEVLGWVKSLEDLSSEAENINAAYRRKFKCLCNFPINVCSSYPLRTRAEAALTAAADLKKKAGEFADVADDLDVDRVLEVPNPKVIGMDTALEELQGHVRDDDVIIIGIHGMGGVGKTALLRRFNNDFAGKELDNLDVVIYLDLPTEYQVEELQKPLFSQLKLTWKDEATQRDRAGRLFRVLSKMRFLLLLDNVWEPLNCQVVGIPLPQPPSKSKIVFATRMEDVCSRMGAEKTIKLECLSSEEAWDLFRFNAKLNLASTDASILDLARALARQCAGLPAALISVAHAMASKRTFAEWRHVLAIMKEAPFQLPGMEEHVYHPLKLSYDRLSDTLRTCASNFALVQEGRLLSKQYVTDLWIGQGFINDFEKSSDTSDKASYLLGMLLAASLIQRFDDKYFKMHPMVRSMILWMECDCGKKESKWLKRDGHGLAEAPGAEKWRVAERISLGWNNIALLPDEPQCPDLIYLNLRKNPPLRNIPNKFFSHMPCLRILDLQQTSIEELPSGIGNLSQLQLLDLSFTKIASLPREIQALVNLRYLAMPSATHLRSISSAVIPCLHRLQWLDIYNSYSGWRVAGALQSDGEGILLDELESLKKLKVLGITISSETALRRLSELQRLAAAVHWLQIEGCGTLARLDIPSTYCFGENMKNLKQIRLQAMPDLEEVIIGGDLHARNALSCLNFLYLSALPKAKIIWKNRCLANLCGLDIQDCNVIDRLLKLEDNAANSTETITIFPRLTKIVLRKLPELESLSDGDRVIAFPSLKTMEVRNCPKLKKLTLVAENLREIQCDKEWWDKLDWSDERTLSFQKLFKQAD